MSEKCCIVGRSQNRADYEKLRIDEGLTFRELSEIAKEEFKERISYSAFWKHFTQNHPIRFGKEDEKKQRLRDEIDETLDTISELKENVKILRSMTKTIVDKKPEDLEVDDIRAAQSLLSEIRQTLKTLTSLTNELHIGETSSKDEIEEFYSVLEKIDPEMQSEIVKVIEEDMENIE